MGHWSESERIDSIFACWRSQIKRTGRVRSQRVLAQMVGSRMTSCSARTLSAWVGLVLTSTPKSMTPVIRALRPQGTSSIVPGRSGHGRSLQPPEINLNVGERTSRNDLRLRLGCSALGSLSWKALGEPPQPIPQRKAPTALVV